MPREQITHLPFTVRNNGCTHGCSQLQVLHIYQITAGFSAVLPPLNGTPAVTRDFLGIGVLKEMINSNPALTVYVPQLLLYF